MIDKDKIPETAKNLLKIIKEGNIQIITFLKETKPLSEAIAYKNSQEDVMLNEILKSKEFDNFLQGQLERKTTIQSTLF